MLKSPRVSVLCVLAAVSAARAGLGPDDLLLVTNRNVPASGELAAHYAEVRHVPAGRILALDLPNSEDITPADYEAKIATPVRQALQGNGGIPVRCIVTFYGVPLHVGQRPAAEADKAELAGLRKLSDDLLHRLPMLADALDKVVQSLGQKPAAVPPGPEAAGQRIESAGRQIQESVNNLIDPAQKQAVEKQMQAVKQLAVEQATAALGASGLTSPLVAEGDLASLASKPRNADSRAGARAVAAKQLGLVALLQVVQSQIVWTDGQESDAAVDSELSLVQNADYPHFRWQANPLNFRHPPTPVTAVMVCRIDAPTLEIAKRIIDESAAVEASGLTGKCVVDSRGLPKTGQPGGYGWFDDILRQFGVFMKAKSTLETVTDDRAQVLVPNSVSDVALYCGWYSLRQYIPSCRFKPGAVAYHVASLELVSMHDPNEKGWVPNLLKDGVDATLGAVSEPYLSSFPRPDEFYPLLLTGKFTVAEAYWATCPMTSWKIVLVGDPLYKPFAAHPGLAAADLPVDLQAVAAKVTAGPPGGR